MAKGAGSSISQTKRRVIQLVDYCKYCGNKKDLGIDHIFPPSRGGNSDLDNLTRCCVPCNSMKGCMTTDEWKVIVEKKIEFYRKELTRFENIMVSLESKSYKIAL